MSEVAQWPWAGPLAGNEIVPMGQGSGAVRATVDRLLSRAAGRVLPFEIGGQRVVTVTNVGLGVGASPTDCPLLVAGDQDLHVRVGGFTPGVAATVRIQSRNSADTLPYYGDIKVDADRGALVLCSPGTAGPSITDTLFLVGGNALVGKAVANTSVPGVVVNRAGQLRLSVAGAGADTTVGFYRDGTTTAVGSITTTGTTTSFNTTSDYRVKLNLEPLTGALDRIDSIPVYRGNFTADPDAPKVDMFLAHEAQAGVPEAVTGEKDAVEEIGDAVGYREHDPETGVPILASKETLTGITQAEAPEGYVWTKTGERPAYQGIDQSKLVPLHHAGIQELRAEIRSLKARLEALEAAA